MRSKYLKYAGLAAMPALALFSAAPVMAQPYTLNDVCQTWPDGPKPRPKFSTVDRTDPEYTKLTTGLFPKSAKVNPTPVPGFDVDTQGGALYPDGDSFGPNPPNMLPTIYANARSCMGNEIINTLSSTPERPYNLHVEDPLSQTPEPINITSPTDDLRSLLQYMKRRVKNRRPISVDRVQQGIDILEGNPVEDRAYSGFPVLHYNGPLKTGVVDAQTRTVEVHQIYYDSHIESDVSYIDPSAVMFMPDGSDDNGEWYIDYTIDVLNRGHEDFSPDAMFFDDPSEINGARIPGVGLDQTFFPMEEGLRYHFKMKMPPARFYNLTYTWGWRQHPPRVQVSENILAGFALPDGTKVPRNYFEKQVFGDNPRASEEAKLQAISMIGDLAPAKRMWSALREIEAIANNGHGNGRWRGRGQGRHRGHGNLQGLIAEFEASFDDWQNRTMLPRGFVADPDADVTLVYLNNTIYGNIKGYTNDAQMEMTNFNHRGDKLHIQLLNGDYYDRTYILVDLVGGMRGWENTFQNTIPFGGAGPWFTFGRANWWVQTAGIQGGPIIIPAAERPAAGSDDEAYGMSQHRRLADMRKYRRKMGSHYNHPKGVPFWMAPPMDVADVHTAEGVGRHDVDVTFTYEPSRRLRIYQFDLWHHDVAVWSMH